MRRKEEEARDQLGEILQDEPLVEDEVSHQRLTTLIGIANIDQLIGKCSVVRFSSFLIYISTIFPVYVVLFSRKTMIFFLLLLISNL